MVSIDDYGKCTAGVNSGCEHEVCLYLDVGKASTRKLHSCRIDLLHFANEEPEFDTTLIFSWHSAPAGVILALNHIRFPAILALVGRVQQPGWQPEGRQKANMHASLQRALCVCGFLQTAAFIESVLASDWLRSSSLIIAYSDAMMVIVLTPWLAQRRSCLGCAVSRRLSG